MTPWPIGPLHKSIVKKLERNLRSYNPNSWRLEENHHEEHSQVLIPGLEKQKKSNSKQTNDSFVANMHMFVQINEMSRLLP